MVQLTGLKQAGLTQHLHIFKAKAPQKQVNGHKLLLLQQRSHFTKTKHILTIYTLAVKVYTLIAIHSLHLKLSEAQIWKATPALKRKNKKNSQPTNKTEPLRSNISSPLKRKDFPVLNSA